MDGSRFGGCKKPILADQRQVVRINLQLQLDFAAPAGTRIENASKRSMNELL